MTNNRTAKSATLQKTITTVLNVAPTAVISTPTIVGYDVTVTSVSTDSDGTVTGYRWAWGDTTANSTTATAVNSYTLAGTYTITLIAVDNDGALSTVESVSVTVPSAPPVASFTANVTQLKVDFNASGSTFSFGAITSYVWNFGDSTTQTTTVPTVSKTYSAVGTYTVTLQVSDIKGAKGSTTRTVVTLANEVPISNFNVQSLNGYTAGVVSTSTDSDGTIASYKWSWGDSTANDTTSSPTHTYTQAGTYTISLTVVDNDSGQSTIKTSSVTVPTVLPVSSFTATVTKLSVFFNASSSTSQFGTTSSYVWNFGDTNTVTTTTPTTTHVYTTVGTFTVSMNVIDDKNA